MSSITAQATPICGRLLTYDLFWVALNVLRSCVVGRTDDTGRVLYDSLQLAGAYMVHRPLRLAIYKHYRRKRL